VNAQMQRLGKINTDPFSHTVGCPKRKKAAKSTVTQSAVPSETRDGYSLGVPV
jgi:hypothetical protein